MDSNVFAFTELRSGGLELSGRGKAAKAERKEEWGDDGGSKRGEEVRLEGLKREKGRGGDDRWYRECGTKGCEIVKRRGKEVERGMNCRGGVCWDWWRGALGRQVLISSKMPVMSSPFPHIQIDVM